MKRVLSLLLLGCVLAGPASALQVTGSFSGWWDQPEQQNHGVIISVTNTNEGKQAAIFWAVFDNAGQADWFFAQGPTDGNQILAQLYQVQGPIFLGAQGPGSAQVEEIGTLTVTFDDCNNGNASFITGPTSIGSGSFPIARLTQQVGSDCTGGLIDDISRSAATGSVQFALLSTTAASASGSVVYDQRVDRVQLTVSVSGLPAGDHQLRVNGRSEGTLSVSAQGSASSSFRSPVLTTEALLDFNPLGSLFEVLRNGEVVLAATAPATLLGNGGGQEGPPPFGSSERKIDLINTGVYPQGSGDAEIKQFASVVEFDVDIEDVPVGPYLLRVGGVDRGTLQVAPNDGRNEAELEFRFPVTPGKLLLDFNPLGQRIEVFQGATLVFFLDFPLNP